MKTKTQHRVRVTGSGNAHDIALIDIAIGHARRGEQVLFCCFDGPDMARLYSVTADIAHLQRDTGIEFDPANVRLRWPATGRGYIQFACENSALRLRGYRATVAIVDEYQTWLRQEIAFARTVISRNG